MATTYSKTKGLRYFNVECMPSENEELLIVKYGASGLGILTQLWRKIYREHGYFINWNRQSMQLFAHGLNINTSLLQEVLEFCFEENLFSREMFEKHQILTSKGIQMRWKKIVIEAKRTHTDIIAEYNLLPDSIVIKKQLEKTPEFFDKVKDKVKVKEESTYSTFYQNPTNLLNTESKQECVRADTHTREENFSFKNDFEFLDPANETKAEEQQKEKKCDWVRANAEKKEKEKNSAQKEKEQKVQVRALVWLTKAEIDVLRQDLPEDDYNYVIDKISAYKVLKGCNYASDFHAIKYWGMDALREHKAKTTRFQYSGTAKTLISRTQMANESHAALLRKFAA